MNEKVEIKNRSRLLEDCHKMVNGQKTRKTKTTHIVDHIMADNYARKPLHEIHNLSKQDTKTIIISRFRMLECGINFKNSNSINCPVCKTEDNEDHRMNHCIRYRTINFYDQADKVNFDDVYSTDTDVLKKVITKIEKVWNTRNAHGSMSQ